MKLTHLLPLALALPAAAIAGPEAVLLTYDQFEAAVPHVDLESCPSDLVHPATFCRATLNHDEIHVFAFSEDGESPMTGFASYSADTLGTLLK